MKEREVKKHTGREKGKFPGILELVPVIVSKVMPNSIVLTTCPQIAFPVPEIQT